MPSSQKRRTSWLKHDAKAYATGRNELMTDEKTARKWCDISLDPFACETSKMLKQLQQLGPIVYPQHTIPIEEDYVEQANSTALYRRNLRSDVACLQEATDIRETLWFANAPQCERYIEADDEEIRESIRNARVRLHQRAALTWDWPFCSSCQKPRTLKIEEDYDCDSEKERVFIHLHGVWCCDV